MTDLEPDSPAARVAPQEVLSHVLAYVAFGNEMATRTAQLHAEIERLLQDLARIHAVGEKAQEAVEAVGTLPAQLKSHLEAMAGLPAQTQAQVAKMGREVLQSVALQFEELHAAEEDARRRRLRHWLELGLGGVAITLGVLAAVSFLDPGLEQVQQRRDELVALRADEDRILLHAVHQDGSVWVPVTKTVNACTPEGSKHCTLYGRVQ